MPENEIFAQMLNDFAAANPAAADTPILKDFCAYAKNWLLEKGVIGVAQTANGFALRMRDGSEHILFSANYQTVADQPAFSISGGSGSARPAAPMADTSFRITG